MTGQEIAKALRCCAKGLGHDDACENCKVGEIQDRREYIEFAAANVIERLTAENAALREEVYSMSGEWCAAMSVLNGMGSYDRLRELAEADKDGRVCAAVQSGRYAIQSVRRRNLRAQSRKHEIPRNTGAVGH